MRPAELQRIARFRLAGSHVSLRGVRVDAASRISRGASLAHHVELLETTVGRYASIGRYTKCHYADIGAFDSVAWDATIGATGHPLDRVTTHAFPYRRSLGIVERDAPIAHPRTTLGPDVWIGTHVVVMPGVTIGAGAVVGAGGIVTADVPPFAIVHGAPARVARMRADDATIERLLRLAWWDWGVDRLRIAAPLLAQPIDEGILANLEALATDGHSPDRG